MYFLKLYFRIINNNITKYLYILIIINFFMQKITFIKKIWKTGSAHVITIPRQYIKDNLLEENKNYNVTLEEESEGSNETED